MKRVVAIRHAPTQSTGLCVGNAEIPCTLPASDAAAMVLAAIGDSPFASVWTSPSERCRLPATLIARHLALPLHVDERLQEISLGRWQLQTWASIEATDASRYASWLTNWLTEAPPEGELPSALLHRVRDWWLQVQCGSHLLISHAGVHRALRVFLHGKSWEQVMGEPVPHLQHETFASSASS